MGRGQTARRASGPMGAADPVDLEALMDEAMRQKDLLQEQVSECTRVPVAVVRLEDGGEHVCYGGRCASLELNSDSQYVCRYTGFVYGSLALREGLSTGRLVGSTDPDVNSYDKQKKQWRCKRSDGTA